MTNNDIIPIILLNWNGWNDTVDCLSSLYNSRYKNFCVVVADNGSTDDSIPNIIQWLQEARKEYHILEKNEKIKNLKFGCCYLIQFDTNHGFAKGNNLVIESLVETNYQNALLLNNDTQVTPDFLTELVTFRKKKPQYKILTPLICCYDDKEQIWNAGGKLFCGFRKYYHQGKNIKQVKLTSMINITFVTGCALFFHRDVLTNNKLFTERFFFGEEDFELSMRMKKLRIKMACVTSSLIYHKVSSSTSEVLSLNKTYVYYLSRFINIKLNTNAVLFQLWKYFYSVYVFYLLRRKQHSFRDVRFFIKKLFVDVKRYNKLDRDMFFEILNSKNFYQNG